MDGKTRDLALRRHSWGYPGVVAHSQPCDCLSHPCRSCINSRRYPDPCRSPCTARCPCASSALRTLGIRSYRLRVPALYRVLQHRQGRNKQTGSLSRLEVRMGALRFSAETMRILPPRSVLSIGQAIPRRNGCDALRRSWRLFTSWLSCAAVIFRYPQVSECECGEGSGLNVG